MTKREQQRVECVNKLEKFYFRVWNPIRKYGWKTVAWIAAGIPAVMIIGVVASAFYHANQTGHDCLSAFTIHGYSDRGEEYCSFCRRFAEQGDWVGEFSSFAARWILVIVGLVVGVGSIATVALFAFMFGGMFLYDDVGPWLIRTMFWCLPVWICTWWHLRKKRP